MNTARVHEDTKEDVTLLYVHDPMCGWCYGFSPVINRLHDEWSGRVHFEILSGGLATGERAVPIGETRGYIREALKRVETHSGVEFGPGFSSLMEEGTYVYDSVPPARAVAVVRQVRPEDAVPFASSVQRALFYDGLPLDEAATYRAILKGFPQIDVDAFLSAWEGERSMQMAQADFERSRELGARSYPTLLIKRGERTQLVPKELRSYEELDAYLAQVVAAQAKE